VRRGGRKKQRGKEGRKRKKKKKKPTAESSRVRIPRRRKPLSALEKPLFADSGRKGLQGGEGSGYFD
jgi:hypothetical protein